MEVITISNGDYQRFVDLVISMEHQKKDAFKATNEYLLEFGKEIEEISQLENDCLVYRRTIAYCRSFERYGKVATNEEVNEFIARQYKGSEKALQEIYDGISFARKTQHVPMETEKKVEEIFDRVVRLLHPLLNPYTTKDKTLSDLFHQVVDAYQNGNLEKIEKLEPTVREAFYKVEGNLAMVIKDIDESIEGLENQLDAFEEEKLKKTEAILQDPVLLEGMRIELTEKKADLTKEKETLIKRLAMMADYKIEESPMRMSVEKAMTDFLPALAKKTFEDLIENKKEKRLLFRKKLIFSSRKVKKWNLKVNDSLFFSEEKGNIFLMQKDTKIYRWHGKNKAFLMGIIKVDAIMTATVTHMKKRGPITYVTTEIYG